MENRASSKEKIFSKKQTGRLFDIVDYSASFADNRRHLRKSESISTSWAALDAASLPEAMATEQSASRKARISLTPSPVIPTVFPCFFNAFYKQSLLLRRYTAEDGVTLHGFEDGSLADQLPCVHVFSAPAIPASIATLDTVTGLSPEITLISTPFSAKYSKVSFADFRIGLVR